MAGSARAVVDAYHRSIGLGGDHEVLVSGALTTSSVSPVDDREFNLAVHDLTLRQAGGRRTRTVTVITIVAALLTALASNIVTVIVSNRALRQTADQSELSLQQAAEQFDRSRRSQEYDGIIGGLTAESSAVQINSLRRLGRYVQDATNFRDPEEQRAEANTTVKTLAAFIREEAGSTKDGLRRWETPPPPAVGPALDQLNVLQGNDDVKTGSFDIALADLHGTGNLRELRSHGGYMVGVDFRRARLDHLDLTELPLDLRRSFLTCADLSGARFGSANLQYADLSGSNLSGADLSTVVNLRADQLAGVTIDEATLLPAGVNISATAPWDSDQCARYARQMAGVRGGAGYDDDYPCPTTTEAYTASIATRSADASADALIEVCVARTN